jgi:hypothetical protein
MTWLLKMLGGSFGPYLTGAVGALLAISLATAAVQGARLKHAKADLALARASLTNPGTHKTWQSEALAGALNLESCNASVGNLKDEVARMNVAATTLQVESERKVRQATDGFAKAQKGRASAEAMASKLLTRPPGGIDACARMEAADAAVLETVR